MPKIILRIYIFIDSVLQLCKLQCTFYKHIYHKKLGLKSAIKYRVKFTEIHGIPLADKLNFRRNKIFSNCLKINEDMARKLR